MLTSNQARTRFGEAHLEFRRTWADVVRPAPNDQTDELRYFEGRVEQELELAAAATHPGVEATHLELARAYRARVRAIRSRQEVLSWLNEEIASPLLD